MPLESLLLTPGWAYLRVYDFFELSVSGGVFALVVLLLIFEKVRRMLR